MARECGMSVSTIHKSVKRMEFLGLLYGDKERSYTKMLRLWETPVVFDPWSKYIPDQKISRLYNECLCANQQAGFRRKGSSARHDRLRSFDLLYAQMKLELDFCEDFEKYRDLLTHALNMQFVPIISKYDDKQILFIHENGASFVMNKCDIDRSVLSAKWMFDQYVEINNEGRSYKREA
jgi:hypothetical protein